MNWYLILLNTNAFPTFIEIDTSFLFYSVNVLNSTDCFGAFLLLLLFL
jgi:hypothetical protein